MFSCGGGQHIWLLRPDFLIVKEGNKRRQFWWEKVRNISCNLPDLPNFEPITQLLYFYGPTNITKQIETLLNLNNNEIFQS